MKRIIILALVLVFCISTGVTAAQQDKTSVIIDGIDIGGLAPDDQASFLKLRKKAVEEAQKKMAEESKNKISEIVSNPSNIELAIQWRTLIVSTIKETATDLNFAVNEFVKTPVGMWTAIILFYNLMGKTVIHGLWSIFFVPIAWIVITGIVGYLFFYFCGMKKIIVEKTENKVITKTQEYIPRYKFKSNDSRTWTVIWLMAPWMIFTIICFIIVAGAF